MENILNLKSYNKYLNLINEGLVLLPDNSLINLIDDVHHAYRDKPLMVDGETHDVILKAGKKARMDNELDLAILKINDGKKYKSISLSKSNYSYGDKVYAIGNTSNYGIGISEGIISVPEVNVIYNDISRKVIQSDIDIASGNSGGALLNKRGQLIGITTFRTKDLSNNVNYGFAYSIPVRIVKEYIGE